ncbi:GGDEF domain-containing protein [Proteiniborus sp. MB09-C3]|uniref:GGDEF domain-containing protein n=1 Tax=Proteiniborus sp. MB09-C3 TaxID=3050072 RepID=UPI0025527EAB|nr:GGDEF domain-containing protein [Proteiniborus sp. MB09-C3]WIV13343.1 GGDEF domain-containing protein [Proteiniborus sp. MB09-C3]
MDKAIKLEEIEFHLDFFKKMYPTVRIVDPCKKKIIQYYDNLTIESESTCYAYWKNNAICENCISMRAYLNKDTVFKLEYVKDKFYMVTAMPIETTERIIVLELLKEVTSTMLIDTGDYDNVHDIKNYIINLNEKVVKDNLTNLYNRRFIDERLPVDIIRSTINRTPISIIMTDIDQLKKINDVYGHLEGDLKVKEYGRILSNSVRGDKDWVARFGGDEFLICLNNTDNETAYKIAERIRKDIENNILLIGNNNIKITGSFGICTMYKDKLTAEEMIKIADKNLYEAKNGGKNKVY